VRDERKVVGDSNSVRKCESKEEREEEEREREGGREGGRGR
jgi:hypothetical protein